jgi:basic amino acid/polyamine antiporter, APA family
MSLWTRKPMSVLQAEAGESGTGTLKRSLGALNLTLLGIGAIIGAGIFVLTGQAAACQAPNLLVQGVINLPATGLVACLTILLVFGMKESATFNNIVVFLKMVIVVLVIGFGFMYVHAGNWHPFMPANTDEFGHFGLSAIARGAGVVFFAYIGFDAVSTAAQEAKNPQRDLPVGILASLAVCTVLYILMALVMTGLTPFAGLDTDHPVYVAINAAGSGLKWLTYFINIGAIAGLSSVMLVNLMGQPRIFFTMARDGLLPPVFGRVHPKFQTPYVATIVTGIVAMCIAGAFPLAMLGKLVSIGTLLAFCIVCGGIIVLRRRSPEMVRPFRTPLVPTVPLLGILFCGGLMLSLRSDTWWQLGIWMAIGLVIYFFYGRHHSKLRDTRN